MAILAVWGDFAEHKDCVVTQLLAFGKSQHSCPLSLKGRPICETRPNTREYQCRTIVPNCSFQCKTIVPNCYFQAQNHRDNCSTLKSIETIPIDAESHVVPKLACNCPKCNSSLQFDVGDKPQLKITCPKCQNQFQIKVPNRPTSTDSPRQSPAGPAPRTPVRKPQVSQTPQSPPQSDPFPDWTQTPPRGNTGNTNRVFANQVRPKRAKNSSFNVRKLFVAAVIAVVSLGGVGLVLAGIMWGKQFLPGAAQSGDLSSALSGSLFGSDSRSSVAADLQTLRTQVEQIGRSIPSGDQSDVSAQRLLAELPKFHALFRRACKLPIEPVSMAEFADGRKKMHEVLERLRSDMPNGPTANAPFPLAFWSINTGAKPDELVIHAINEVTTSSNSVSTIMSEALIDFPDPLTYTGPEFEWSAEDRRVLAIIRLQGGMERDALRALAMIDPKAPSPSDLNKLHSLIDQAVESAKELSNLASKSVGGMLAFVPKGNPYESQQVSSMIGLDDLRKFMKSEAVLSAEVDFLFDEVNAFSEMAEGIIFSSRVDLSSTYLAAAPTSSERFKAFIAAGEKLKADAVQAEVDRKEEEKQQLAAAQLRVQKAAEDQRKDEEDRQRAMEERIANASSGKSGGRRGTRGPGGLTEGPGPRSGPIGIPTGPGGVPIDAMGDGRQPGQPPNFPGFGAGPPGMAGPAGMPGMPQDRFQSPPAIQGDPAKLVTITCANVKNGDSSTYLRDLPKWLLQYAPSILISNGNLKITVQNYDKPLADLGPCFPSLVFVKIDTEARTIMAKEK